VSIDHCIASVNVDVELGERFWGQTPERQRTEHWMAQQGVLLGDVLAGAAGGAAGGAAQQTPPAIPAGERVTTTEQRYAPPPSALTEMWLSVPQIMRELAPNYVPLSMQRAESVATEEIDVKPPKLLLVMVGLPARGKSFLAHRLTNYLTWYGLRTRVFNVGAYRRKVGGNEDAEFFDAKNKEAAATRENLAWTVLNELLKWLSDSKGGDVGIFDATNTTDDRRVKILEHCKAQKMEIDTLFIESICDDEQVLEKNLMHKVKNSPDYQGVDPAQARADFLERVEKYQRVYQEIADDSLSYIKVMNLSSKVICNKIHGRTQHRILAFLMSLHVIERPVWLVRPGHVDIDKLSFWTGSCHPGVVAHQLQSPKIKPMSTGSSTLQPPKEEEPLVLTDDEDEYWGSFKGNAKWQGGSGNENRADSYSWPHRRGSLPNPHARETPVENLTTNTLQLMIPQPQANGASLNADGVGLAQRLAAFIQRESGVWGDCKPHIFTSTLPRSIETGRIVARTCAGSRMEACSALNPIDVGACHGMTMGEIRQMLGPEQLERMRANPAHARLPGGESQQDVTKRLEPFIVDYLERQVSPVVVISHLSTLQILYEYFLGTGNDSRGPFWALSMPVGTVIQLVARFGGASAGVSWEETRFEI